MIQEEIEILLKDLCARLPYGVKVHAKYIDLGETIEVGGIVKMIDHDGSVGIEVTCDTSLAWTYVQIDNVKPYLFPLSSMTEEQEKELRQMDAFVSTFGQICFSTYDDYGHELIPTYEDSICITDWLLKNHFDYRGLIPKGLAIDATGLNMY